MAKNAESVRNMQWSADAAIGRKDAWADAMAAWRVKHLEAIARREAWLRKHVK